MSDERRTKIIDRIGNTIEVGSMMTFVGQATGWICEVVEIVPGGLSLVDPNPNPRRANQTPTRVRVIFDTTIAMDPNAPILREFVRVVNPKSEYLIKKALEKTDPSVT